jgi:soluble lytic murein transglycosylase-like protein
MLALALLLSLSLGAAAPVPAAATPPPHPHEHDFDREIDAAVAAVQSVYKVPRALVRAVIRQESQFNPRARSAAGAVGLMQVMPFNARKLGLREDDLRDPTKNVLAGTRLLALLLRHYKGDLFSALAGYNAVPRPAGAPIPKNGETPHYVRAVLAYYRAYKAQEPPEGEAAASATREWWKSPASGSGAGAEVAGQLR